MFKEESHGEQRLQKICRSRHEMSTPEQGWRSLDQFIPLWDSTLDRIFQWFTYILCFCWGNFYTWQWIINCWEIKTSKIETYVSQTRLLMAVSWSDDSLEFIRINTIVVALGHLKEKSKRSGSQAWQCSWSPTFVYMSVTSNAYRYEGSWQLGKTNMKIITFKTLK